MQSLWRLGLALLLPLLALLLVQLTPPLAGRQVPALKLDQARLLVSDELEPPPGLSTALPQPLPLRRRDGGALWLEIELPAPDADGDSAASQLLLSYRPGLAAYLDGLLLAQSEAPGSLGPEGLVLGLRRLLVDLPPALHREPGQRLQLRLAAPGPAGAVLEAPLLGTPQQLQAQDRSRQRWQMLRALTAGAGVMAALFLALVAWVRRNEPVYALAAAHVALLALLLSPYLLLQPPLPSPWWRVLLDIADLAAKVLLVALAAQLAQAWNEGLRRLLIGLFGFGLLLDGSAAMLNWSWSNFGHPWPWWALGSRALLLLLAWGLSLQALRRQQDGAAWGTALLVGFSACTWAWISLQALLLQRPVLDSHALAYAGWVLWVVVLLQRHFIDAARRDAALQRQLGDELAERSQALQLAFEAQAVAERERATAEQRRRLLQDLHDGLGARLLQLRLAAPQMDPTALQQAIDECLLEMRLSVDSLVETEGDIGVLLGGWRQRVEGLLRAADVGMDWRVRASGALACLRGGGGLELVRWLQEALSNALRHGQPSRLIIATQWNDASGNELLEPEGATWLVLYFIDNGRGLPQPLRSGQGLRSLQTRAQRLGATLNLHSPAPEGWLESGRGTALVLRLPLSPSNDDPR